MNNIQFFNGTSFPGSPTDMMVSLESLKLAGGKQMNPWDSLENKGQDVPEKAQPDLI